MLDKGKSDRDIVELLEIVKLTDLIAKWGLD
jgi:hypothetical protein